jgi:hypothetical protein
VTAAEARARVEEIALAIPHACALCAQGWKPQFMIVGFDLGWWHGHLARCGAHALRTRAAELERTAEQAASLN